MPASLATVASILKEIYEPRLVSMLNEDAVTLRRIERTSEGTSSDVNGRYVTFPLKVRRNQGIGARNELELLPTPGQQGYAAARVGLKYLYGALRLSGQTFELADTNRQAFVSAVDQEIDGLKEALVKDQNRMVYGDGTGTIGTVDTAGTGVNTVNLDTAMYVQMGEQVDVVTGSTLGNPSPTIVASNRQVTAINETTGVVTLSGTTFSTVVGDVIVRNGSVNREWTGLKSIVKATGVLYNVDPAVEPSWAARIDSNGGTPRAVSEALMIKMVNEIRRRGGKTTAIFSNYGVQQSYFNLLSQQRQFVNTKTFTGGFSGLAFTTDAGEIPFVTDFDTPHNSMWFLNEKELKFYRSKDWSWMNRDGNMWKAVAGYDAYDATFYQYSELGCHKRNSFGRIDDLIEA